MTNQSFEETYLELVKVTNQVSTRLNVEDSNDLTIDSAYEMILNLIEEMRIACEELQQQNEELVLFHEQLLDQKNIFEKLFDYSPIPYITTDSTTVVKSMNKAAARFIGLDPSITKQKPLTIYIATKKRSQFYDFVNSLVKGNAKLVQFESEIQPRSNSSIPVIINVCKTKALKDSLLWTIQDVSQSRVLVKDKILSP